MFYLNKCEFAEAGTALCVSDGDLSVVFDPPSSTEDVVYTRGDLVPFILISKPKSTGGKLNKSLHPKRCNEVIWVLTLNGRSNWCTWTLCRYD